MNRKEVLEGAMSAVCGDRDHDYGGPERSFECIASMFSTYLQCSRDEHIIISAHDVAVMMAILKIARIAKNPKKADSWVDLAGYAACGGEIATTPTFDDIIKEADEISDKYCESIIEYDCENCPVEKECNSFLSLKTIASAMILKEAVEQQIRKQNQKI